MRRIAPRWATPYLLLLLAPPSSAAAQDAVVSRNVNLRHDPSTNQPAIRLMLPGAELFVLDGQARTNGYYHVRAMDGAEGWAYSPRVRILPPPPPGPEAIFNNCPLEGNAAREDTQAQNRLKNRTTAPQASDINPAITLQAGSEAGGLEVRAPLGGCARRASLQGRKVQAGLAALGRLRRSNYAD